MMTRDEEAILRQMDRMKVILLASSHKLALVLEQVTMTPVLQAQLDAVDAETQAALTALAAPDGMPSVTKAIPH